MTVKNLVTNSGNGLEEEEWKKKSLCGDPEARVVLAYVSTDFIPPVSHSVHYIRLTVCHFTLEHMPQNWYLELVKISNQVPVNYAFRRKRLQLHRKLPFWAHIGNPFLEQGIPVCCCLPSSFLYGRNVPDYCEFFFPFSFSKAWYIHT